MSAQQQPETIPEVHPNLTAPESIGIHRFHCHGTAEIWASTDEHEHGPAGDPLHIHELTSPGPCTVLRDLRSILDVRIALCDKHPREPEITAARRAALTEVRGILDDLIMAAEEAARTAVLLERQR